MRGSPDPFVVSLDHPVWRALSHYSIGPDDAALPFAARLARENGWSADHTERVIEEYRRFCFLAVTAPHQVTPSDAVDQAWHLHLTYTRDYWERFCPDVLGRALHHGPTAGAAPSRGASLNSMRRRCGVMKPCSARPRRICGPMLSAA
jgi:hypothetical protein